MIRPPKLTEQNKDNFFGVMVESGDLMSFSYTKFLFKDVKKIAEKHGFHVVYCPPRSPEYSKWGDATCYAYKIGASMQLTDKWDVFKDKIGDLIYQFRKKKEEAARVRDELRELADEISEIVESFEDGVESMEYALSVFGDALDDMSRHV